MSTEPKSYLYRVFRDTELLNKQTILGLLDPRPGGKLLDCGCGDDRKDQRHEELDVAAAEDVVHQILG